MTNLFYQISEENNNKLDKIIADNATGIRFSNELELEEYKSNFALNIIIAFTKAKFLDFITAGFCKQLTDTQFARKYKKLEKEVLACSDFNELLSKALENYEIERD